MGRGEPPPDERQGTPEGDGRALTEAEPLEEEIAFLVRVGLERGLLNRAARYARARLAGKTRRSGEPLITHAVEVARILDQLRLDATTIASGLLHDVVEDSEATIEDVERNFGSEIAFLVGGVTKIGQLQFASPEKEQADYCRNMLLSTGKDIRVILIKLADRLHNMRTLQFLPPEKIRRIARETLDIYAPLAHRFGIAQIKWELEDLAFKHLEPEAYRDLMLKIAAKREERERYIEEFRKPIEERLREAGLQAEIKGRAKHFYSIHNKMRARGRPLEEIYDLLAVRVVTSTVKDCYHVLGIIHTLYTPVHERFRDFIATPKTNMYRSLHTTVIGPSGEMVEVQIRTRRMHLTAEFGIAAHWRYKEGLARGEPAGDEMGWLLQVIDLQKDLTDPEEFLEVFKGELFQHEVFVFTPGGDLKRLPRGATALDFAFAVHTEVGYRCVGAKVNGRIVPLRYELKNGETVEIITSASASPTQDWLAIVKTARARTKVRHWLNQESFQQSKQLGREILERELRRLHFQGSLEKKLAEEARSHGLDDPEQLLAAIGRGDLGGKQVAVRIAEKEAPQPEFEKLSLDRIIDLARRGERGIRIQGVGQLMVRFAKCCQPLPGDRIVGVVTRGRGVSVHRSDCPNVSSPRAEPERVLDVSWDVEGGASFPVKVVVAAEDRQGLLADLARVIGKTGTNIRSVDLLAEEEGAEGVFIVEVTSLGHLNRVLKAMRGVRGVMRVERRDLL
ncbi:MAG: bifunctional (p)ppGpp synthetase/guanosine-3',5'-bis(diphosphate) 3'-pyrophosphohydrolase [Candidatus Eisenbacteria bacterium]